MTLPPTVIPSPAANPGAAPASSSSRAGSSWPFAAAAHSAVARTWGDTTTLAQPGGGGNKGG
jgi:hypothetical protein